MTRSEYFPDNIELTQNTLFMDVGKKIINNFATKKKTFSVGEGALFNTIKYRLEKFKNCADFKVLYRKNYCFVTTSVDFWFKILNW